MTSLKSKGYVKEQFAMRSFYWYLTSEGTQHLRSVLNLAPEVVPATQKSRRACVASGCCVVASSNVTLAAHIIDNRYVNKHDSDFIDLVISDLTHFLSQVSVNRVLIFPPVENRYRFLIHKTVEDFSQLGSFSVGEGTQRRTVVCLRDSLRRGPKGQELLMYGHQDQPAKGRGRGRGRRRDEHSSPSHNPGAMKDRMEYEQMPQDVRSSDDGKQPEQKQQRPSRLAAKGRARPRRPEQQLYVPRALRNKEDNSQTPVPNSKRSEKPKENQRTEETHLERGDDGEENRVAGREGSGMMRCKEAAHTCSAMDTDAVSASFEKETVHAAFAEDRKTVSDFTATSGETVLCSSAVEREAAHMTSAINSLPAQTPATQETLCSEAIAAEHAVYSDYSQQDEDMAEPVSCDTVSEKDNRAEAAVCSEWLTEDSGEHTVPAQATEQLENVGETDELPVHKSDSNVQVEELSLESAEDKEDPTLDTHKSDSSVRVEELSSEFAEDKEDPTLDTHKSDSSVRVEELSSEFAEDKEDPISDTQKRDSSVRVEELSSEFAEDKEDPTLDTHKSDSSVRVEELSSEFAEDKEDPISDTQKRDSSVRVEELSSEFTEDKEDPTSASGDCGQKVCDLVSPSVFCESTELKTVPESAGDASLMEVSPGRDISGLSCESRGYGTSPERDSHSPGVFGDDKELRTLSEGAKQVHHMSVSSDLDSSGVPCENEGLGTSSECTTTSEIPHREVSQDMDSTNASCDSKELRSAHGGAGEEPHMEESLVMDSSSASCGNEKLGTSPGDVGDHAPRMEMSPERLSETSGSSQGSEEEDGEDSWDRLYDDNGDCLDPSVVEQLSTFVGEVEVSKPKKTINYLEFAPKEPDLDLSEYSHVIEISDFPVSFKTEDLLVSFKQYMNRGFDLKWVDDTHALGIFSSTIAAKDALQMIHPMLKVRPLSEASKLSRQKAKRCQEFLQPFKPRPQTSAAAARRLVTGALGLAPRMTKEKREEERRVLKEAREKKRSDRKRKDDIWNGEVGKCAMDGC